MQNPLSITILNNVSDIFKGSVRLLAKNSLLETEILMQQYNRVPKFKKTACVWNIRWLFACNLICIIVNKFAKNCIFANIHILPNNCRIITKYAALYLKSDLFCIIFAVLLLNNVPYNCQIAEYYLLGQERILAKSAFTNFATDRQSFSVLGFASTR